MNEVCRALLWSSLSPNSRDYSSNTMGYSTATHYTLQSTSLFVFVCIALYYCLTGRGGRAGDVAWALEGIAHIA